MANNGAMVALLACRFDPRLDYSMTIHGSAEFFDVHRLRLRDKVEGAVFVRCISEFCRAQVMTWTSRPAWARLHVVHCGLDPDFFACPPRERDGVFRVLAIGRLVPIKGYPQLLDAIRSVSRTGVECRLRVVGDGPMRAELAELASRPSPPVRVEWLGPQAPAAVREELRHADVLAVSSFMEGTPVVLMEAMAAGVPVVATRVGGVAELIEDGRNGLLVTPGSVDALSRALCAVWADEGAAKQRAQEGHATVLTHFHIRDVAQRMRALFQRYLPS
jgi:glycosyltransferase involved in cell wall biosynthesis